MEDRYRYWVALLLVPGLGARYAHKLVERFGSPQRVFTRSLTEIESCGVTAEAAQAIALGKALDAADRELDAVRQLGCRLIAFDDADYPALLKQTYDPPVLLYLRGDAAVLNSHCLAIVGSRHPTAYGNAVAEKLARELAGVGLVIVSGMARGIDSAAQRGALAARAKTIAVFGCGIDVIYPKENKKLAEQIEANGALVTEFPVGSFPAPQNFPIRNRIISGMSLGVMIVEAAQYSGSLITARLAMEQNREVFAVPGNITAKTSFGPNLLIKQGAKLVTAFEDVIEELPAAVRSELLPKTTTREEAASLLEASLTESERAVFASLKVDEARHIDEIMEAAELNSSEVLATLFQLEMRGIIRQLPGKYFIRVLEA